MHKLLLLLLTIIILTACESEPVSINYEDLPEGNAESGETLFTTSVNDAPACSTCHTLTEANLTGPGLGGYGEHADNRVDNESAEVYTFYSILRPTRYLVNGFSNVMYDKYEEELDAQQIADLIAYLLTQ